MAVLCRVNMWDWPANHANQRESKKMGWIAEPTQASGANAPSIALTGSVGCKVF